MAAAAETVLRVERLTMRFGGLIAINDLSFEAKSGAITALIGPNGAGKTTVFNCITGFYKPTEGRLALQRGDAAVWDALETLTESGKRGMVRPDGGGWYEPQVGQPIFIPTSWQIATLGPGGAGYVIQLPQLPTAPTRPSPS